MSEPPTLSALSDQEICATRCLTTHLAILVTAIQNKKSIIIIVI